MLFCEQYPLLCFLDTVLIGVLVVFAGIVIWINYKDKFFDYIIALFVAGALSEIIKYVINKPRPCVDPTHCVIFEGGSFPSGHTTVAFTAFFFYILACHTLAPKSREGDKKKSGEGYRKYVFPLILLLGAVLVALLRLSLGAHVFVDILAGILIAFLVALPFRYYDVSARRIR